MLRHSFVLTLKRPEGVSISTPGGCTQNNAHKIPPRQRHHDGSQGSKGTSTPTSSPSWGTPEGTSARRGTIHLIHVTTTAIGLRTSHGNSDDHGRTQLTTHTPDVSIHVIHTTSNVDHVRTTGGADPAARSSCMCSTVAGTRMGARHATFVRRSRRAFDHVMELENVIFQRNRLLRKRRPRIPLPRKAMPARACATYKHSTLQVHIIAGAGATVADGGNVRDCDGPSKTVTARPQQPTPPHQNSTRLRSHGSASNIVYKCEACEQRLLPGATTSVRPPADGFPSPIPECTAAAFSGARSAPPSVALVPEQNTTVQ